MRMGPVEYFVEGVERPGDGEGDPLGAFERERLRGQLADDDVEEGDDAEGDDE
jgi:hypothetical protein